MTLTDHDIKEIGKLFAANNEVLADYFASKDDLNEAIDGLRKELERTVKDSESRLLENISSFAKEIKDNRDERTVQSKHISENRRRIEKLEERVFKN